jgi:hypothetical protein
MVVILIVIVAIAISTFHKVVGYTPSSCEIRFHYILKLCKNMLKNHEDYAFSKVLWYAPRASWALLQWGSAKYIWLPIIREFLQGLVLNDRTCRIVKGLQDTL